MPPDAAPFEQVGGRDFQMVAVSVDTSWEPVVDFYASSRIDLPTLLDPGQHTRIEYGVFAFPETFLIDAPGTLVRKYIGWRNWTRSEIVAEIERWLPSAEGGL